MCKLVIHFKPASHCRGNSSSQSVEGMHVGNLDLTLTHTYVQATFASIYTCACVLYCVGGYSTFGVCACVCMCVCVCLTMWLWVCTVTLKYYVMVFGAELITPLASLANRCINKQATGGSQRELIHHLPCHCFHYSHISFENPLNILDTLLPISSYLSKLLKNEWNLKSILSVSS